MDTAWMVIRNDGIAEFQNALNRLAREGWSVFQTHVIKGNSVDHFYAVLKKGPKKVGESYLDKQDLVVLP